jgi:hypothetical protein
MDVRDPAAGTWTGVLFGDVAAKGGTNGTVGWRVATQEFASFGSVSPSRVFLDPGESKTITVSATTPTSPGDAAGSIVFRSDAGGTSTIPVALRSEVDIAQGGAFSGTLTGGNGRPPGEGQDQFYQFQVGAGVHDITASVSLSNDARDPVGAYLISPDGDTLGYGQNSLGSRPLLSLTAFTLNPVPGTWTLIVAFTEPTVGDEISQPFTGSIQFNKVSVSAAGLPDSTGTQLTAGKPVTVPVTITNNGTAPEAFFVDPRLNATKSIGLAALAKATNLALPLTVQFPPQWLVPTQTSSLSVTAKATLPIMFDYGPFAGDPDIASSNPGTGPLCADTESSSYTPPDGTVTAGGWSSAPSECGPYPGGAPAGTLKSVVMTATTKAFDRTVTSATGDLWSISTNPSATFTPIVINPGATATIKVVITPAGTSGTTVHGTLYVDDFVGGVPPYGQSSGDELAGLPYAYTIK